MRKFYKVAAQHVGSSVIHERQAQTKAAAIKRADKAAQRGYHAWVTYYWDEDGVQKSEQVYEVEAVIKEPW